MSAIAETSTASPAYWDDHYGWLMAQLDFVRGRQLDKIDWENIAEDLEDMGRSEYRSLESALRVLLLHLLKWDHQVSYRSRAWLLTIKEQQRQYRRILDENPSLRQHLEQIRQDAYKSARRDAVKDTGFALYSFPKEAMGWNVIENPPATEDGLDFE